MDTVEERLRVAGRSIRLERPRDREALLDEHAFEHEEYLPYWAELWPSALALAEAVAGASGRMLELGCGLALPSIVAALDGADVLATDWSPEAIRMAERNARRNGAPLRVRRWRWDGDPAELGAPWPLVVAADVLYERRNGPQLLALLPRLVAPGGEAWIADPGRPPAPDFLRAAAGDWQLGTVAHGGPPSVTIHRLSGRA